MALSKVEKGDSRVFVAATPEHGVSRLKSKEAIINSIIYSSPLTYKSLACLALSLLSICLIAGSLCKRHQPFFRDTQIVEQGLRVKTADSQHIKDEATAFCKMARAAIDQGDRYVKREEFAAILGEPHFKDLADTSWEYILEEGTDKCDQIVMLIVWESRWANRILDVWIGYRFGYDANKRGTP